MYWFLPFNWSLAALDAFLGPPSFVTTELCPRDADEAADLHGQSFAQGWTGDDFAALLDQPGVFGFIARRASNPLGAGVVLARLAAGEAEILTIAVDRNSRGRGIGRLLMDQVLQRLHAERAEALFLEVEEENRAAIALYRRLRFVEVGRRPAYYADAEGRRTSALVLKRTLR